MENREEYIELKKINKNTSLHKNLNLFKTDKAMIPLIIMILRLIKKSDPYTFFHSKNVAYYSVELGKALNLSKKDCFSLYIGGLIHDVGKIKIPEEILNKPSPLTSEEYNIIKTHPEQGYEMLKNVPLFEKDEVLNVIRYHHERFDGEGYPAQLKGNQIPIAARIIAVADSFDAMTTNRVYRKRLDLEDAINEIEKGKGTQFDPYVAETFLNLLKQNKLEIKELNKKLAV